MKDTIWSSVPSFKGTRQELIEKLTDYGYEAGMIDEERSVIAVQYHPESAAGPEDSEYVFTRFTEAMKKFGGKKNA